MAPAACRPQPEVAECIGAFRFDEDPEIRRQVLALLLDNGDVLYDHERLGHLAFDRDRQITETVWSWFGQRGIKRYLNKLGERAKKVEWLHPRELALLTMPAFVPPAKCVMKLTGRLRVLCGQASAADQLACTLRALEIYAKDLGEDFWMEAAAIARTQHHPDVTAAWQALQKKAGRRDSAPTATRRKKRNQPTLQPQGIA